MVVKLLCFVLDKFKENSFVIKFFLTYRPILLTTAPLCTL